jgi:hypothetical protein
VTDFTGPYAPGTWAVNFAGTAPGGNLGIATRTPISLTITGGNGAAGCTGGVFGSSCASLVSRPAPALSGLTFDRRFTGLRPSSLTASGPITDVRRSTPTSHTLRSNAVSGMSRQPSAARFTSEMGRYPPVNILDSGGSGRLGA